MSGSKFDQINPKGDLWTKEEVEFLAANRLNYSMSELAKKLGRSRGAIAGKSKRIGIKTTATHHKTMIARAISKAHADGKYGNRAVVVHSRALDGYVPIVTTYKRGEKAVPKHMVEPPVGILNGVGVKIGEIESHHCKWVVGEPSDLNCCGNRRREGSPYCEDHHQIAYKPRKSTNG